MKITSRILIGTIKIYKIIISPYLTPSCRYLPTCSEYAIDSIKAYGLTKGIIKSIKRSKCFTFRICSVLSSHSESFIIFCRFNLSLSLNSAII